MTIDRSQGILVAHHSKRQYYCHRCGWVRIRESDTPRRHAEPIENLGRDSIRVLAMKERFGARVVHLKISGHRLSGDLLQEGVKRTQAGIQSGMFVRELGIAKDYDHENARADIGQRYNDALPGVHRRQLRRDQ